MVEHHTYFRPIIPVVHQLARAGGTLIGRCLASMDRVQLLSEVHPLGKAWFDPRRQALEWFQLLSAAEAAISLATPEDDYLEAITLIQRRAMEQGKALVLSDWTHLDFTAIPFRSSPTYRLTTADVLSQRFDLRRAFIVRHPFDQFLSLRTLDLIKPWDDAAILHGFRRFAEEAAKFGFFKCEDFCRDTDGVLKQICERLGLTFDSAYKNAWQSYDKITGDTAESLQMANSLRQADRSTYDRLLRNEDYRATLEILGYQHPQPLAPQLLVPPRADEACVPPIDVDALFESANTLCSKKQFEDAARAYQQVIFHCPGHVYALNNLGYCLKELRSYEWAEVELKRAIFLKPDFTLAIANLVSTLEADRRRFEAIPYRRRLVQLEPEFADHCINLAQTLISAGRIDESLHYMRRAIDLDPSRFPSVADYLLYLHYSDRETPESIARQHFRLVQKHFSVRSQPLPRGPRKPGQRLRIGYLSKDFYTHPVGKIIQPMLALHDKATWEVFCYHDGTNKDVWTDAARKASSRFHLTANWSTKQVREQILADQIDVLVDLSGHTGGGNRCDLFAARCAPLQVAFLGYPDTTGLPEMDFRITDSWCDPPGMTEHLHTERLVRLQRGFLCYSPPDSLPPTAAPPFLERGYVTFGCFNNIAKVSPAALAAWAKILQLTPMSRLAFKYGDRYESSWIREHIQAAFAANSIDPSRLEFWPSRPSLETHMAAFGEVDIALDSFPYQGTMTTLETLAMSVPIITLQGKTYCSRASSSLVGRLGLAEDLTATTVDNYVQKAVKLASTASRLLELRSAIRQQFLASEICDVSGYVDEFESVISMLILESPGRRQSAQLIES